MDTVITLKIGETLAFLRGQKGVTQEVVADALGISNKTISKWETGISIPEAEYILALADYFEVSTDEIFGRVTSKNSIDDVIVKEFENLSYSESVKKSFLLAFKLIKESIWKIGGNPRFEKVVPDHIVSPNDRMFRAAVSSDIGYEILINNPYTNLVLMLFQNECDFSWLDDNAVEFSILFQLLADTDGIKMVKLMYTQGFSQRFTSDFIAKKIGIEVEKADHLLKFAVKAKVCALHEANLRDGKTNLYECHCNGMVLAILNLAYELSCGIESNEYSYGGTVKMIRGDKK
jgi:transcriptional regulator with XRE-family HTH domain